MTSAFSITPVKDSGPLYDLLVLRLAEHKSPFLCGGGGKRGLWDLSKILGDAQHLTHFYAAPPHFPA